MGDRLFIALSPYLPYYKEKYPNDKTIEIAFNILKD